MPADFNSNLNRLAVISLLLTINITALLPSCDLNDFRASLCWSLES
jgi:hypothetical protein